MGATQRKWDFYQCIMQAHTHEFAAKKNKVKITRCSGMSKFCPPAAASRKLMRGNNYDWTRSRADGGWGVGGTQQNWKGSATSLAQTAFLFWGFVFKSAGNSLKNNTGSIRKLPQKKTESDSKTANLIFRETKG